MFKSQEANESQFLNNTTLSKINDKCNGVPKITSTPLNSHIPTLRKDKGLSPAIRRQGTPRRYSLSELSPSISRPNVKAAHSPGPLLASLTFKDNVSIYEETKSSGIARRIVLYNEEAEEEKRVTHQEKYSSPGLFPIVHLFKEKPPLLEQSPRRVKIKLSSPEYLRSYSPHHRNTVLQGISKPRLQRHHSLSSYSKINDTGTKSVLDALKEISRKRIHSNEDYDVAEESGKRLRRTELSNGPAPSTSKRTRGDSPLLDSSGSPTPQQSQKKLCVYDEFAASKSSSDFSFLTKSKPLRFKRKTISTSTESLNDTKHVKLVNAETQTLTSVSESEKTKSTITENLDETDKGKTKEVECAVEVFDETPLDKVRKSRLVALMGNLAGKDAAVAVKEAADLELTYQPREPEKRVAFEKPSVEDKVIAPPPEIEKEKEPEDNSTNKNLVSILSPSRSTKESSPLKTDRHVQFNVSSNSSLLFSQTSLTQTSTSVVTPIISDSVAKSPISHANKEVAEISFPISSSAASSAPSFSFGSLVHSKSETNIGTTLPSNTINSSSAPSFSFLKPAPASETLSSGKSATASPQKSGGFKFDLKTPISTSTKATTSTIPALSFTSSPLTTETVSTTSSPATFSFGTNNTAITNSKLPSELAFGFGGISKSQSINFAGTTPSTTTTASRVLTSSVTSGFSFGNSQTVPIPAFGSVITTTVNNFANSSFSTPITSGGFGTGIPSFGTIITTKNSVFGDGQNLSKAPPTFTFGGGTSTAITTSSVFGTSSDPIFGTKTTSVPTTTLPSFNFGSNSVTNLAGFNAPTTSAPVFGNTTIATFGNTQVTKSSVFGSAPTTSTSVFGNNPVTTASVFGNAATAFGSSNISSGLKPLTAAATSAFGNTQSPFGLNTTSTSSIFATGDGKSTSFGSSNVFSAVTQAFGSNTTGTFGSNTAQQPALFGSASTINPPATSINPPPYSNSAFNNIATTVASTTSTFGTSSTPTFNFGSSKSSGNPFGSATTTTNATSTFGGSNVFSSPGGFNSNTGFGPGSTSNTFGVTNTPAFGQVENKPAFGFGTTETKPSSVFGSGSGNSAFVKPTNNQNGFGTTTGGFGSTNTSSFATQQANGGFNFGSNTSSPAPPPPYGFGASASNPEPPKPSFNFTGGATNPPAFGAGSAAPAFGAASQSFGGSSAPAFVAAGPPAAGVFNIGAGSTTPGRPRTLRAKRRT